MTSKTSVSELENKKVKFYKKQTEEVFGKHAIIEDPDGHLISLVELSSKDGVQSNTLLSRLCSSITVNPTLNF